jgi:uncharacterized protein (TIRG00374 family)
MRTGGKNLSKWLPHLIGPIILMLLLTRIDISRLVRVLSEASLGPIITAWIVIVPALFFRTARWRMLLTPHRIHMEYAEALSVYAFANFVGMFTPGRVGDLIKVFHLKNKGVSFGAAFFGVLMDRLLDLLFILFVGCGALTSLALPNVDSSHLITATLGGIALFLAFLWFATRGGGRKFVATGLGFVAPTPWKEKITHSYGDFCVGFTRIRPGTLMIGFSFTALAWGVNYYALYLFGVSLGFNISFLRMAGLTAILSLVGLLPVSIMGVGTRDAVLIVLLSTYNIPEVEALAFSALCLSLLAWTSLVASFSLFTPAAKLQWRSEI